MAPENEGKLAAGVSMGGRTLDVLVDSLMDVHRGLVKVHREMEDICSSDVMSCHVSEGDRRSEAQELGSKPAGRWADGVRGLAIKQESVKVGVEVLAMKVMKLLHVQSDGDFQGSNLHKRSRPAPAQLHEVARVPGVPDRLDGLSLIPLPQADGGDALGVHGNPFDSAGDMPRLKIIRTETTKAPYQKPTIYMPQAKLGVPVLDAPNMPVRGEAPSAVAGIANKPQSPKKRPARSRRERNKGRVKNDEMPPAVMQKLKPGDTNKIPEDGYLWRKYGNKPIKTANYKRGYYKCRHFKEVKCNATKIVQQTDNDPSTFSVCYKGEHTCQQSGLGGQPGATAGLGPDDDQAGSPLPDHEHDLDAELPDDHEGLLDEDWQPLQHAGDSHTSGPDDDPFAPSDGGEDVIDSSSSGPAPPPMAPAPASPSIISLMPPIAADAAAAIDPCFTKSKYEYPETCPPEGQGFDGAGGGLDADDNDQLLQLISGGSLWEPHLSDITYWSLDTFPFPQSPTDLTF